MTCTSDLPDMYYMIGQSSEKSYWLQIDVQDLYGETYDYYTSDNGSTCYLKVYPISLGFNILGLPAYMGYYVEHGYGLLDHSMAFSPLPDSLKPPLELAKQPERELPLVYYSTNLENGEIWALAISSFLTLVLLGLLGWGIYVLYETQPFFWVLTLCVCGFLLTLILFEVMWIFLNSLFMPGDVIMPVNPIDDVPNPTSVGIYHASLLTFIITAAV